MADVAHLSPPAGPIDVLVLGGAGVDTIVYVPELPLPFADSIHVPAIRQRAGQTGDGVAVGLAALGLRTTLVDVLGDDHEGDLVRGLHRERGVPFVAVPTAAGTKRAVNLVDPAGRRLSLYDGSRVDPADRLPAELIESLARRSRHVHVSITHPCRYALDQLAGLPVTISTDLHDWDGVNPHQAEFAYRADIVLLSAARLPDPAPTMGRILREGRARVVIAMGGAEGGYLMRRDGPGAQRYPAVPPPGPVADSNGAGDAFTAGFLFGYLAGEPLATCVRYGAVAGAHACTVPAERVDPLDPGALLARYRAAGLDGSR